MIEAIATPKIYLPGDIVFEELKPFALWLPSIRRYHSILRQLFWKGKPTNKFSLDAQAGNDPSIDRQVAEGDDDVFHQIFNTTHQFNKTDNTYGAGIFFYNSINYKREGCARFLDITLPQAQTVDVAYLTLYARGSHSGDPVYSNIDAEDVDTATQIADEADWESRVHTTAFVAWDDIPAWTDNETYNSPEIKTVIQEVVDRGGWESGNAINIFWLNDNTPTGATRRRNAESYNGSSANAPKLHIEYLVAAVGRSFGVIIG